MTWRKALKRTSLGLLLTLLLLVLLLLASVAYVTATTSGLQQLLALSQRWLPGELQIQQLQGTLLDTLDVQGLSYRNADLSVSLQRLHLGWNPGALWSGKLHIRALALEQPVIKVLSAAAPEPAPASAPSPFPIAVPELNLPVQVQLEQLLISDFELHQPVAGNQPSAPPLRIDRLLLQLHTEQPTGAQQAWILEQLEVAAPQGQLQLDGRLTPSGQFPMQLSSAWQLSLPEQPPLQGRGSIGGTLAELNLDQQLSGLLKARVSASLQQLLHSPRGTLQVEALELDLGLASPELKGHTLRGRLEATGDLQGVAVDGHWQARLPEVGDSDLRLRLQLSEQQVRLQELIFRLPATAAELQLRGDVNDWQQAPQFALSGNWKNLGYPLQGAAAYRSAEGQLQLNGGLKGYRLQLTSSLSGTAIPASRLQLSAEGSDQGLKPFTLTADTLDGQLRAEGQVNWLAGLSWQLALSGQRLNPGSHWPDWPGKLNFKARSSGSQPQGEALQLQAQLQTLSGTLRQESVQGRAEVELRGAELAIRQLQLLVAGAQLQASGTFGEQLNLDWSLNAAKLEKLLPNGKGSLIGKGTLRGPQQQLQLIAELESRDLQLDDTRIASLDADLDIDLSGARNSAIQVQASQVNLAGQRWRQLRLEGSGTPVEHQLQLALDDGPVDLQLNLSGSWRDPEWRGSLSRFDLDNELSGPWRLRRPIPLQASVSAAGLDGGCWQRLPEGSGELCLDGRWSAAKGASGTFQASRLPLKLLDPWLPAGTQVDGQLQADGTFSQAPGDRPRFQAQARLLGAELLLEEEDLNITAGDISLYISAQQQQLNADLKVPLRQPVGALQAQVRIDDLYERAAVEGQLDLQLSELKFISLFTPQVQAISGTVESALKLSGTVDQPQLQGYLRLLNGSAELPALGIKLDAIELALRDKPGSSILQLNGSLRSADGNLQLTGEFDPLKRAGQFALDGKDFQAVATREVQTWISPSIQVDMTPQLIKLRGEVTIPRAKISPPEITSSTPLSSDVVILDPESKAGAEPGNSGQTLDARLRVTLGEKVEVDALGFKGRLQGSVLVEDDGRRATRATGTVQVAAGRYRLYGQDLNIGRGSLVFSGGPVDNPGLDLRITRQVDTVTAGAKVSGTLQEPRLTLFSEPAMPESSLLSYLLLGRPPGSETTTPTEQELLLNAASALAMKGGNAIAEKLSDTFTLDDLGLESGDTVGETSLYIGKYLSPRLYVKYGVGLLEPTNTFFMRYRLSKRWSLESQTGTSSSGGDIIYTIER